MGHNALGANTTASNNVAVGNSAMLVNTTGASNVAVGATALDACTNPALEMIHSASGERTRLVS